MLLIYGGGGIAEGISKVWPYSEVTILEKAHCNVWNIFDVDNAYRKYKPQWVVNCAGVSRPGELRPGFQDKYREEIGVNLVGAFHVADVAGETPTVMLASVAGLYGKPGHAGYSASKAGVISLVQSLAMEGRPIWAVSPGRVDTKMREKDYPDDTKGSRLAPEQIGAVVVDILIHGLYSSGTNVVIRKEGLDNVLIHASEGDGWKERLKVGSPKTI